MIYTSIALGLSLVANLYFLLKLKKQIDRPKSLELQEFIGELMDSGAIIDIKLLNKSDIFLRRPTRW